MMWRSALALSVALTVALPAAANDTTAELGTGGLIFVRSDRVSMASEDLYISPDEVRVTYEFRNPGDEDIVSVVAFPMPDISANPYAMQSIPDDQHDNFLGFTVEVEGRAIQPQLDQRVVAAGVDVTDEVEAQGVPLFPYGDDVLPAIAKLTDDVRKDWYARGIVFPDEYDDGSGMKTDWTPYWTLRSTYWWTMTFPANKTVTVKHSYKPSVGGTVGLSFIEDSKAKGERYDEYKAKYCMDGSFVRAVEAAVAKAPDDYSAFYETWISYILKTGGNWATTIEKFRLTIDKGAPENLVSFCGEGVKKTGPTTFEMTAEDFYPVRDLDILILNRIDHSQEGRGN